MPDQIDTKSPLQAADIALRAADRLASIADRFVELQAEIRAAQPVVSGAVILYLYRHSTPCLGCPHPKWKIWQAHPKARINRWRAHPIANPLQRIRRNKETTRLRHLIEEAIALEAARKTIVKNLSSIRKSLQFHLPPRTKSP